MSDKWYYVESGERRGPVSQDDIISYVQSGKLTSDSYVWVKGFDDWRKVKNIDVFQGAFEEKAEEVVVSSKSASEDPLQAQSSLREIDADKRHIYIKTGFDRNQDPQEYGPFTIEMIKKLYKNKRINAKTLIYFPGLNCWKLLASFSDFESFFDELPPLIDDSDRRKWERKPFMARLFFTSDDTVFEGLCKDISLGGLQILIDGFPGKIGDEISMNVHPENSHHQFVAKAEIVRILDRDSGFSMKFIDLSEEAKNAISSYLNTK